MCHCAFSHCSTTQVPMTQHPQYVTVRNTRGRKMFDLIRDRLEVVPTVDSGNRRPFVLSPGRRVASSILERFMLLGRADGEMDSW